jgi:hypothetical protein
LRASGAGPRFPSSFRQPSGYALKCSFSPGLGQSIATGLPVASRVMYAVFRSAPPKQILVVIGSGIGMCSIEVPSLRTLLTQTGFNFAFANRTTVWEL